MAAKQAMKENLQCTSKYGHLRISQDICHVSKLAIACVAGENGDGEGEGEGKQGHGRKMGDWGLGTRERLLQRPLFFHFCGRQRPQNSDWLIFDSKSHENHVI